MKTLTVHRRRFIAGLAAMILSDAPWIFAQGDEKPALHFREAKFYFRWTNGKLFEFTPQGQSDLKTYSDMVSVLIFRDVRTPEDLAAQANAVLQNYKEHGGVVVKTSSVAATSAKPAEHFLIVMLSEEGVVEVTFARFVLLKGIGHAALYAHRAYGPDLHENSETLGKWLGANGPVIEEALLKSAFIPSMDRFEQWSNESGSK